jgi:hypothetical protein
MKKLLKPSLVIALILSISLTLPTGSSANDREDPPSPVVVG